MGFMDRAYFVMMLSLASTTKVLACLVCASLPLSVFSGADHGSSAVRGRFDLIQPN